ncbi:putative uncharacterized protein [Prevotella sp. CAG:873]|nr:putative uncharacterized protein [Prevotella sp. CAG:873]
MKRILTIIVTLVCVFAAYSQNTVYIWKDNTLSVQAADSIAFYADNVVDLGLSVCWESDDFYLNYLSGWMSSVPDGRLPTDKEFKEFFSRCSKELIDKPGYNNDRIKFIGPNGNIIYLNASHGDIYGYSYFRYWTNIRFLYAEIKCDDGLYPLSFRYDQEMKCRVRVVWDN